MLLKLSVNNYALIDKLDIDFDSGLSIITGETGSGKSILLGALSLILGQRADTSVLQDKSRKCIIEGEIDISSYDLESFFSENQLDFDKRSIVRREIGESGKSRAFINDTPVNLNVLKDFGTRLVDIHSQHHNLLVAESRFQLDVIDVIAQNFSMLQSYREHYTLYSGALDHYRSLKTKAEKAGADLDYFRFQLEQLNDARLIAGEQEELEEEQQLLTHSEEISEAVSYAGMVLNGDDNSLLALLKDINDRLAKTESFFPRISELLGRLQSSAIELKDVSNELGKLGSITGFDPGRVEFVSERLDLLYGLQQKHHVSSVDELIAIRDDLKLKVDEIDNYEFSIDGAMRSMEEKRQNLEAASEILSESRRGAIPLLEEHMVTLLRQLGIPNARFVVGHQKLPDFTRDGCDRVVFNFSANRQSPPMELSKVASGGEMSRVMLSLKSFIAKTKKLPTIIFDEIDSGVSGEVAGRLGNILKNMSANMQVINITHLPQVAGKGDQHFLVYKEDTGNATHTRIRLLDMEERVNEIARMLSSDGLTPAAIVNARELMG